MGVVTSRESLKGFSPNKITLERIKLETSNLVCMLIIASPTDDKMSLKGRNHYHVTSFAFGK